MSKLIQKQIHIYEDQIEKLDKVVENQYLKKRSENSRAELIREAIDYYLNDVYSKLL